MPCTVSQSKFRSRAHAARAGQSLWCIKTSFRKRAVGLQPRLRTALGESAIFQRCGSRCGEKHTPETHLIPLALAVSTENGLELQIYGSDYSTADGTCLREEEDSFPNRVGDEVTPAVLPHHWTCGSASAGS